MATTSHFGKLIGSFVADAPPCQETHVALLCEELMTTTDARHHTRIDPILHRESGEAITKKAEETLAVAENDELLATPGIICEAARISENVYCHPSGDISFEMDPHTQSVLSTDEIDLETSAAFGFSSRYRTALAESLDIYIASIRSQCKIVSGVFCTENDVNTSLTILITSRGGASKSMWYGAIYSQYSVDIPNIRSSDALPVNIKVILTISFWPQPLLVSRDI
eukprot:GHVO01044916.1.p1 GENE.GHVO01044916.1~~GHVO01044916.1.p1  ORF type:complete len:233 (+),score=17.27 GHVO01044916.1:25-699(+)